MNHLAAFSSDVLAAHKIAEKPAVKVDLLAHRLNVLISERRLPPGEYGRTVVIDNAVSVVLRSAMPVGRRRFVLAHELGHTLCADPSSGALRLRRALDLDEERFCDRFAEALLMPEMWLHGRYGKRAQSLISLLECARLAQVSPAAASIALRRHAGWTRTLVRFQRDGDRWRLMSVTGYLPASPGQLRGTESLSAALDSACREASRDVVVDVRLGDLTVSVPADVLVAGRIGHVLADFSPHGAAEMSRTT